MSEVTYKTIAQLDAASDSQVTDAMLIEAAVVDTNAASGYSSKKVTRDQLLADVKEDINGWSDDTKVALLNAFAHVAWEDEHGQDYVDALTDALYPEEPPATLESISCVYTQSGTVYNTDSLDSLKADLVVTATYSDSTTATISSGYTLSGTLTTGTSEITVTYNGKTDTFNVTVTAAPLYALENATSTETDYKITTTKGGHVKIEILNNMTTSNSGFAVNLKTRKIGDLGGDNSVLKTADTWFSVVNGQTAVNKAENLVDTSNAATLSLGYKEVNASSTPASIANISISDMSASTSTTGTIAANKNVGNAFVYIFIANGGGTLNAGSVIEFDMSLTINGNRYV